MNREEARGFTLEEVIKEYKQYNSELAKVIESISNILKNKDVSESDYKAFAEFRQFNFLFIAEEHFKNLRLSFITDSICNIFKDNIDAFQLLNLEDKESDNYANLLGLFIDCPFAQTDLLCGLSKLNSFLESIHELEHFCDDISIAVKIAGPKVSVIKDYLLDLDKFRAKVFACENDIEKIEIINNEIKYIKLSCTCDNCIPEIDCIQEYINNLEKIKSVLEMHRDYSLDVYYNQKHNNNNNNNYVNEPSDDSYCSEDTKNEDHTMIRKAIAIYYLFNEISQHLYKDGNKSAIARFTGFLTGNNVSNITKAFRSMYEGLDDEKSQRRADFEYVIMQFEKINLGCISDDIRRDIQNI